MKKFVARLNGAAVLFAIMAFTAAWGAAADVEIIVKKDIPYKSGDGLTDYEKERCMLDLYLPKGAQDFSTIVWFHGGSIQAGNKSGDMTSSIARWFAGRGIAVAAVNYRLSPKVHYPAYINDAAASAAWVIRHIEEYQGNPERVFVSGHSAGGYLTAMTGADPQYLAKYGASVHDFAGFMPVSGQMVTHTTVRGERGIPATQPVIDEAAPSYHVRKDLPPFLNICGSVDLPARAEENRYFATAMNAAGHEWAEYREFIGRDHGTIVSQIPQGNDPVAEIMMDFMRRVIEKQ